MRQGSSPTDRGGFAGHWWGVWLSLFLTIAGCSRAVTVGTENEDDGGAADARPPTWNPPIDEGDIGEPGWRDSTEPWCPRPHEWVEAFDVWSRPGEVYALIAHEPGSGEGPAGIRTVAVNSGTGWRTFYEETQVSVLAEFGVEHISGFPDGRVIGFGEHTDLYYYHDGGADTEPLRLLGLLDVFVVSDSLAYGITRDKIIHYNGSVWAPVPAGIPHDVRHLWADETSVFAVGRNGTIISLENEQLRIHDLGTLDSFPAVWGFSGEDVWVGSRGLYHYDGQTWTEVPWPDQAPEERGSAIRGMWGKDGVLFFHSNWQLTRWDGAQFDVLGYWPCEMIEYEPGLWECHGGLMIKAIWGNAPDEVFLAVRDPLDNSGGCGHEHLLWWDGSLFHWF